MTLILRNILVPVSSISSENALRTAVAERLGVATKDLRNLEIRKRSIDARKKSEIKYVMQVTVDVDGEDSIVRKLGSEAAYYSEKAPYQPMDGLTVPRGKIDLPPVIIGSGPAGTFAALVLAEAGIPSIVIDRESRSKNDCER